MMRFLRGLTAKTGRPPLVARELEYATREREWMGTASGKKFYPLDPRPEDIDIVSIARGLSMTCRYGGQVKRFYSVAEHCWWVSHQVPPQYAREGLLHDAAEAYIGDLIRPFKHSAAMSEFRRIEALIEEAVAERFGIVWTAKSRHAVKEIDDRILVDEITALSVNPSLYLNTGALRGVKPLGVAAFGRSAEGSEMMYLARFKELFGDGT